ncbi:MAG TPA: alpha/beta hydrolase [Pirellulaceae bacterium]|nr:alpha/beta hydrolase [Pirellulaceae bacterium]
MVLVHGLAANRTIMAPLGRALRRHFPQVTNWGYQSLWYPIERHGRELARRLRDIDRNAKGRVHLVTHSMGGIIGRLALADYVPTNFGRFLMIAPPNRGSRVARWLAPLLGRIFPPLVQLTDASDSFVCSLPRPAIAELGVIAARGDFLVCEPSTRLGCETDHIILPGLHSSLLWSKATARQTSHFLKHGRFWRADGASVSQNCQEAISCEMGPGVSTTPT